MSDNWKDVAEGHVETMRELEKELRDVEIEHGAAIRRIAELEKLTKKLRSQIKIMDKQLQNKDITMLEQLTIGSENGKRIAELEATIKEYTGFRYIEIGKLAKNIADSFINIHEIEADRIAELEQLTQWQDIATAPKGGTMFLIGYTFRDEIYEAKWKEDGGLEQEGCFTSRNGFILHDVATHWKPLGPPPQEKTT